MKLAVVGAGSTYTPELVDGLVRRRDLLSVDELALHDPAEERLRLVAGLARRMLAKHGHGARVTETATLEEAVAGADAVVIQLRVGGQAARALDESLPLESGRIGQETTGFGGLAKALRTVPVVLEIAERVRALASGSWIVLFTNPVGIVTKALQDAGHRAIGLCNGAIIFQRHIASVLGVEPERVELDHVGLNHLTWELAVRLDGEDVLPQLLTEHAERISRASGLPADVVRRLGAVPSYYLRYFYDHDGVVDEQRRSRPRAEEVAEIERELLALYADERLDEKPERLSARGGSGYSDAAVALLASLLGSAGEARHVVNVRNDSTLPFLAGDAVVEVPALVSRNGASPLPAPPLDALQRGLVAHVSAYEELALEAALHGGRDRVFRALLAHPLVGQAAVADTLADRLVEANREYLPWA